MFVDGFEISSFNPYSIGSYSGRNQINFKPAFISSVSILILLEVTLEEQPILSLSIQSTRFNPYSIGSYSGRKTK